MHRVVTNLLLNALKYSPPDTPVEVTFSRPRPDHVCLMFTDHGRGIDPDDVDTIFDEFVRGRLAQDDGGTGMGLASARDLVEQQEGSITLDTELGVGTTVSVELPSTRVLKASAPAQRTGSSPAVSVPVSAPVSAAPPAFRGAVLQVLLAHRPVHAVVLRGGLHLLAQLLARPVAEPVPNTVPWVWSVSCCRHRASSPSPS